MSEAPLIPRDDSAGGKKDVVAQREFQVLDPGGNAGSNFANNAVSTAKYSFIPVSPFFLVWRNLYEQFHKMANCYFLLISGLQLIPGLSPTGRFTTLIPLCLVLTVTMVKDAYEDIQRHRSDAELNCRHTLAWRGGKWETITWKDLKVGDLCKVHKGKSFPADLVLIWSPGNEGMCYIETASLDGETNLKIRKSPQAIYKDFNPHHPDPVAGVIVCELPNNRLYNFDGYYEKKGKPKVPLNADNILLRGADLRTIDEIVGITVFTGEDTKLMRNSTGKTSKMSRVDHMTNKQIILVFMFLVTLCLGCTIGAVAIFTGTGGHWYLASGTGDASNVVYVIFGSFCTFLILFNNLIPISLYVTMEMVKLAQAAFINADIEMYFEATDTPAMARTSSLNEELGQVEYIFSDKTGTLTCNMMDFLKFTTTKYDSFQQKEVVVSYGTGTTEIGRAAAAREGRVLKDDRPPGWKAVNNFFFYDPRVNDGQWANEENGATLEFFFQFLAVCHSVIPEVKNGELLYQAASPDEGCLVTAARELGVAFTERTENSVTIIVRGRPQKWDILNVIEFDSARKRMSVICQEPVHGKLMLLCKGADTVIYERLKKETRGTLQGDTLDILTRFASEGLRTLVLGKRDLDEATYTKWQKRYDEASTAIVDRGKKMASVAEEIEIDLDLVGTTAIEDKLQQHVPMTIELLATAGIKIWVLTGDKQETAINIGFACALLHNDMGLFMFDECTKDTIGQVLQVYLSDAKTVTQQDLGLVIQGDTLLHVLPDEKEPDKREAELFLCLATRCKAVICCRVSPLQKASVVKLVRDNIDTVTLAVGDGANDVSMIQAAHVGIGIQGLEGLQAARSADYSIAQFKHLMRLLLIHGRYSYRRISKLILYCFYKNMTLFLTQFWFTLFNMFTGQSLYDSWALSGWNVGFTAFPIIVLCALDRDVKQERLLSKDQFPELYHDGMKNLIFNTMSFWMYAGNAVMHSLFTFLIPLFATKFYETSTGICLGMVGTGIVAYTCTLVVVSLKVAYETQTWMIPHTVVLLGSIGFWFVFLGVYGNLYGLVHIKDFAWWYGAPALVLGDPIYWFCCLLVCTFAVLREICWKTWKHNYSQKLMHIVQEFESQGRHFTRRDVIRTAAHLLPKFQALRPYEPNKVSTGILSEAEISLPSLSGVTKNFSNKVYVQDQRQKTKEEVARAPVSGSFFSQPGKVKIRDVVLDAL